ncbi:MAG: hypothetical protein GF331_20955 [Chitinivibrionales bacterium]|nr:hypothetical protein [Chitinivibrionales bacterium]
MDHALVNAVKRITLESVLAELEAVLSQPTAPLHEGYVRDAVLSRMRQLPRFTVDEDRYGNVTATYRNRTRRPPLVLMAHMDHPGFEVVETTGQGRGRHAVVQLTGRGPTTAAMGTAVQTIGPNRSGRGVVAEVTEIKDHPYADARMVLHRVRGDMQPGDLGMYALPAYRRRGMLVHTRAADDLACVGALLALAAAIDGLAPERTHVRLLFSRAEEGGFLGTIAAAAGRVLPVNAVYLSLEASSEKAGAALGDGVVVRVGDRLSVFDPHITGVLCETARAVQDQLGGAQAFAWQRKLMDGGVCEATALAAYGYRAGALCIPLRNYHNHGPNGRVAPEAVHAGDVLGLVRLLAVLCADTGPLFTRRRSPARARFDQRYRATSRCLRDTGWHI